MFGVLMASLAPVLESTDSLPSLRQALLLVSAVVLSFMFWWQQQPHTLAKQPRRWPRYLLALLGGRRLPRTVGSAVIPGLKHAVELSRDQHHVPYVRAECEEDMWAGAGYAQAQDRAFQLEVAVRAVRGTLSEIVGDGGLPIDRLARRLGFHRTASRAGCDRPQQRRITQAFVRGLNAGLRDTPRPHEFVLLGVDKPTVWTEEDVWATYPFLCLCMASNWDIELVRLKVLAMDGPDALRKVDLAFQGDMPTSAPQPGAPCGLEHVRMLAHDLNVFFSSLGLQPGTGGSNAWAIGAEKSATGRPILANDPHLLSVAPANMYMMRLQCPEVTVCGVLWIGTTMWITGHNGTAAFGTTAAHADNTDLFLEKVHSSRDAVLEVRDGVDTWVPCDVYPEVIKVKGGPDVVERVLVTPRGPIISGGLLDNDLHAGSSNSTDYGNAVSISASYLKEHVRRATGGMCLHHKARSWDEYLASWRSVDGEEDRMTISSSAHVYADTSNTIGYNMASEIPRRRSGHGMLPMPGWLPQQHGWLPGTVPQAMMPRADNPSCRYVATCNQAPAPWTMEAHSRDQFLGADWLDGYRQRRVLLALAARQRLDIADMAKLQCDTLTLAWQDARAAVFKTQVDAAAASAGDAAAAKRALQLLAQWDGCMAPDSVGATVWQLVLHAVMAFIAHTFAPASSDAILGQGFTALMPKSLQHARVPGQFVQLVVARDDAFWHGVSGVSWDSVLTTALAQAMHSLCQQHGTRPSAWMWGRVRPLVLHHTLSAASKVIAWLFDVGPLPGAGDSTTLAQGAVDPADVMSTQGSVAQARSVIDVGNWDNSRFAVLPGQSGNPLSPHFDDLIPAWTSGQGIPIPFSDHAANQRIRQSMMLLPADSSSSL